MRPVDEIIIHTTATRPDFMEGNSTGAKVKEVRRWHTSPPLNWSDVGYHYLIDRNGTVALGRPVERVGAHVKGHNTGTIGVALFGGFGSSANDEFADHYTSAQDKALRKLIADLKDEYGIRKVTGHNNYASKACPGFRVDKWLKQAPPEPSKPKGKPMFSEYKNVFTSKTIWGSVIALLGVAANMAGYNVTSADQSSIAEAITLLMQAGGSLLAIYGRVVATKKIG